MSTVTSFLTNLSIQGQKLAYVDTAPFSINGVTYRGLINTSQSGSDFIITQRFTSDLFHNIQVNETQFMVQVANSDFLPAEIKGVIGNSQFFLSTTNNQTIWYLRTLATTGSQSNVDLTTLQSGFITNSSNLFLSIVNGRLTMSSNAGQFNTVKPSNSNLIIGATSLSGNSGGGSGGITLTPSGALSSSYYIPFSSTVSGVVTTMGTDVSGLIYDNRKHSLTVKSVVTNKIGIGAAPEPTSLSIGTDVLFANISGVNNIGIGNNSLFNNTTGTINIGIGNNSLISNTDGAGNIGIGNTALQGNVNGFNNIAVGNNSLYYNYNGMNNLAFGANALFNNLSGSDNIAIGMSALTTSTEGFYNVAIGTNSLFSNTTGINNNSVGYNSLYNNTTGANNVAMGFNSLFNNNGNANNAIGNNSLYNNTTGEDNVAIGHTSLYNNTTGQSNVAVGVNSLYVNIDGNVNVAIGANALYGNIDGNSNVAIGSSALGGGNGGNSNIGIGINAGSNFTSNESENIVIGNAGVAGDNFIIRIGNNSSIAAYIEPVLLRRLTVASYTSTDTVNASDLINSLITTTNDIDLTLPLNTELLNALGTTVFDNASFNFTVYSTNTTTLLSGAGRINIIGNNIITPGTTRIFVMQYIEATTTWNLY